MSAGVESVRQSALRVGGAYQMDLGLQQVLVLGIVLQPAQQGLTGVMTHASVGQAHSQSHEGR